MQKKKKQIFLFTFSFHVSSSSVPKPYIIYVLYVISVIYCFDYHNCVCLSILFCLLKFSFFFTHFSLFRDSTTKSTLNESTVEKEKNRFFYSHSERKHRQFVSVTFILATISNIRFTPLSSLHY